MGLTLASGTGPFGDRRGDHWPTYVGGCLLACGGGRLAEVNCYMIIGALYLGGAMIASHARGGPAAIIWLAAAASPLTQQPQRAAFVP